MSIGRELLERLADSPRSQEALREHPHVGYSQHGISGIMVRKSEYPVTAFDGASTPSSSSPVAALHAACGVCMMLVFIAL